MNNSENFVHTSYNEGMQAIKIAGNNASQQWKGYTERYVFISDNALNDLERKGEITSAQKEELVFRRKFVKLCYDIKELKTWLFKNVFLAALKRHKNEPTKGVFPYYLHQSLRKAAAEIANSTEIAGVEISAALRFAALRFVGYSKVKASSVIISVATDNDKKVDELNDDDYFTTDAPTTDAPTTDAPTTDAPTTDAPTTDAPTTDAPTTDTAK